MRGNGNTSIRVSKEVWKDLSLLKIREGFENFNDVVKFLLNERRKTNGIQNKV